jgi:hypothetical protein
MVRPLASLVVLSASFSAFAETKTLAVYLNQPLAFANAGFEQEVRSLIEPAGYSVVFRDASSRYSSENFDKLMMVRMEGRCSARDLTFTPTVDMKDRALASTVTDGDKILPFTRVFCDRTLSVLANALGPESTFRRDQLFARALARQVAHEVFHYLTQSKAHAHSGVAKACFRSQDLLAGSLTFDEPALVRMSPGSDEGTEDTGR